MLVLSRRPQETLVFPNLGITVRVVETDKKHVRLGIEAPGHVTVLRGELEERWNQWRDYPLGRRPAQLGPALRNRLQAAVWGLNCLHQQLEGENSVELEATILQIYRELSSMQRELVETGNGDRTGARRALLIQDNLNEAELLAGYLRKCQFQLSLATDASQAMHCLADESVDVALVDWDLADGAAEGVYRMIRKRSLTAQLPLIAFSRDPEASVSANSDLDRRLPKPLRPDSLVVEIDRLWAAAMV